MTRNPLTQKLRRLIEANGPMSVADYMAHCLLDRDHGYYMSRDPFGAKGDFVTAPEVSQMFGEIVGAWLIETWRLCGAPSPVRLVELGPGRGTLTADILQVAALAPDFRAAMSIHLVEASPLLAARQREKLTGHAIAWHSSFSDVPAGPILLAANEFFDALPLRQFVRQKGEWRERVIGLGADGKFAFGIGPSRVQGPDAPEGSIFEIRPAADALISELSRRLMAYSGSALVIDYGYADGAAGETLQAVRQHQYSDPLEAPGEADLTAHVDFGALARAAKAEGAQVHGPVTQGEFLLALGLLERAGRLGAEADETTRKALQAAVDRLARPEQMGSPFKVMVITRPGIFPPPFNARNSHATIKLTTNAPI